MRYIYLSFYVFAFNFSVEYITCALILALISSLHSILVSVLSRCRTQPPVSYATIIQKLPKWTLIILALSHEKALAGHQSFLFSELVESDNAQTSEVDRNPIGKTSSGGPWAKHVVLLDRVMFYLFGLVLCLLIVSILFTEWYFCLIPFDL